MKKIFTILLAAVLTSVASDVAAQQVVKQRIGTYKESGNMVVSEATTTLAVDLVVECEEFEVGQYARYAQKYLGKRASLVNRVSYNIVGADVAVLNDSEYFAADVAENSSVSGVADEASIDRLSMDELADEQAAKQAAVRIYELRAARQDLVLGEFGDGVYGAGLEAALREIERLENEYMALFYGVRTVTTKTHRFLLPVSADAPNSVVARFNNVDGLLAKDNVAGDVVVVSITPSEMTYPASKRTGAIAYRYANNATVTVSVAHNVLTSRILPIYELGQTIYFTKPSLGWTIHKK